MTKAGASRTWTDEQLAQVIANSRNWRSVMRGLGLKADSAGTVRTVRRRADELGLDYSHFLGMHRWSDTQLRGAISGARTWSEAAEKLGLPPDSGNTRALLKSHAIRLGIDCDHLPGRFPSPHLRAGQSWPEPELEHLRTSAASIAAAWFTLSGCAVSVPVEPAVYDLLCELPDGIKRVQVKSTAFSTEDGWQVQIGHKLHEGDGRRRQVPYEPGDIDLFFIVDGDLRMYLIPAAALAGAVRVSLRAYKHYIVGSASGLMPLECQTSLLRLTHG